MASPSPHPTVLSPTSHFAATNYTSHSRSASRSPTRRQHVASHEWDSLLSNLSPVSTLEALRATDAIDLAPGSRQQLLSASISNASTSERALAIRAALAGQKLREWCNEVKEWQWPKNAFQPPSQNEKLIEKLSSDHNGLLDQVLLGGAGAIGSEATEGMTYWGSLQARIVQRYEERIEIIKDDMGKLDLEQLKDYVRGAHLISRSKHSSLYGTQFSESPLARYTHLDDFTVIITATIMQALPYISRLNGLLDIWTTRIVVLRQVPGFLRQLEDAQFAVDAAWKAIGGTRGDFTYFGNGQLDLTREAFSTMKLVLQDRVSELGQRLDAMLDALEGRVDRLPDSWIDSMESVQDDYETWVVGAERLVQESEWKNAQAVIEEFAPDTHSEEAGIKSTIPISENIANDVLQPLGNSDSYPVVSPPPPTSQTIAMNASGVDIDTREMIDNRSQPKQLELFSIVPTNPESKVINGPESNTSSSGWSSKTSTAFNDLTYPSEDQLRPNQLDGGKETIEHSRSRQEVTNRRTHINRLPPLEIAQQTASTASTVSSDASNPGSATSEYYSNMSSPEILDAARVEYFKTPAEDRPISLASKDANSMSDTVSRHSSQRTDRSSATIKDAAKAIGTTSPSSRSRASSFLPEATIFENWASPIVESKEKSNIRPELGFKRASITSIEVLPRSELRNITVRRGSQSSNSSGLSHFKGHSDTPEISAATSNSEPLVSGRDHLGALQASSRTPSDDQDSLSSLRMLRQPRNLSDDQPGLGLTSPIFLPPGSPEKQDVGSEPVAVLTPPRLDQSDLTIPLNEPKSIPSPRKAPTSPSQSIEDQLTARITSILTNIPAHIRLASSPDVEIPEAPHVDEHTEMKEAGTLSPLLRLPKSRSPTPSITLAPAFSNTSKSKHNNSDPDIKLYHLHQPGKDVPTKLYVRLVGEAGERVMVRVGGGWADLGEYLKEYANHHGRRSVSDSRFEIKGLPSGPQLSSLATLSGRSTPTSRPSSPTARPTSSHNPRKTRLSGVSNPSTPDMPARFTDATPSSADSSARSLRSSSLSWMDEDKALGLAGPKSRKGDISPGKKAWVEGVMEQARKASAEKMRAGPGDIVDLGKVGTTRRVFWKGRTEE